MKPKTYLLTMQLFIAFFLLCFSMTLQALAAPTLQANGKIAFTSGRDGNYEIYLMNADGSGQVRLTNNSLRDDFPTWSPDGRTIAFLRESEGISSINLMNADGTNVRQITTLISNLFGISWSPDGAKIAFNDSMDIFTINIDGSNRVNLTNGQFSGSEPAWSPNGSQIAFSCSGLVSYGAICVMNSDGSNMRRITTSFPYTHVLSPDWSPDGGRIVFADASEELSDNDSITLVNPDGTNLHRILTSYEHVIHKPKWSPDGAKIVFYRHIYNNAVSQIWTINRDGSGLMQLTNS